MPRNKRRELLEFSATIVIAGVVFTGICLIADQLPFLLAVAIVGGTAFSLTAVVSASISRRESRR